MREYFRLEELAGYCHGPIIWVMHPKVSRKESVQYKPFVLNSLLPNLCIEQPLFCSPLLAFATPAKLKRAHTMGKAWN